MTDVKVTWRSRTVAGRHGPVRTREYLPAVPRPDAEVVVWAHGGAYVGGSLRMAESHAVALELARTGRPVVAVDYRKVSMLPLLLPKRPIRPHRNNFPVPVEDVLDAYLDTVGRYPEHRHVLGGASAGANLAASATLRAGEHRPAGLILAYGAFHVELPEIPAELRAGIDASGVKRQFTAEVYRRITLNFVGDASVLADTAACPATAAVEPIPPTLFVDADGDTLRASSELYARRLETEGIPVSSTFIRGSSHGFLNKPKASHFREGTAVIRAWLDELPDRCGQRR
ncbi:alpha/beta hydrolase [Actinoplanes sichuanensis]|uniref:Alpha/beta hydrolase n=1 Tax=Actinoplanes sichuanensis TaxID=512349 RepID=A0ABW4AQF7_9ACTN|nr:alpha/beta hydrolase fold domain-containing protein [Actinoplanes sichuanensis]BEL06587.1 alpha/beta hydrolase [Actinoplanes sichuanensis]